MYGQLLYLTYEKLIVETVQRIYAWFEVVEDLSGYELLDDEKRLELDRGGDYQPIT